MSKLLAELPLPNGGVLSLRQGDITEEAVDAIVNAANSRLVHGAGVAGAIVRRGGEAIQRESLALAPVAVGSAVVTGPGSLPAKAVIHAVGPRGDDEDAAGLLAAACRNALAIAAARGWNSVALPAISTGVFGFPRAEAARVLVGAAVRFAAEEPRLAPRDLRFVVFDEETAASFRAALDEVRGGDQG